MAYIIRRLLDNSNNTSNGIRRATSKVNILLFDNNPRFLESIITALTENTTITILPLCKIIVKTAVVVSIDFDGQDTGHKLYRTIQETKV